MRYYENLFIVNPGYEDDALQSIKDEYANVITENGGVIYNVEDWGKRRLAYTIDKQKYGTYVLIEFSAEGNLIRELEESQRLNDSVLAHLTVRLDEEPDPTQERKRYMDEEDLDEEDESEEEEDDVDVDEEDQDTDEEDESDEEAEEEDQDTDEEDESDEEAEEDQDTDEEDEEGDQEEEDKEN